MASRGHKYDNICLIGDSQPHFGDVIYYFAPPEDEYNRVFICLQQSLAYERMDARLRNISSAISDTCTWIRDTKEFKTWMDRTQAKSRNGILWIKGKPGSGKSTIMRELVTWARSCSKEEANLAYFFNAQAPNDLEKSVLGFYRSLTHQLLRKDRELAPVFMETFETKVMKDHVEAWEITELENFLMQALQHTASPVNIFVDALDEGKDDEIRRMVQYLEQLAKRLLAQNCQFRLCLASRHYPEITIDCCISIHIEQQPSHQVDVARFVDEHLHKELPDHLKDTLLQRSNGVFSWVALVISLVNMGYDEGRDLEDFRLELNETPSELHELYRNLIIRDLTSLDQSITLFRWVLFAVETLHPDVIFELFDRKYATKLRQLPLDNADHEDEYDEGHHNKNTTGSGVSPIGLRFLLNRSKGLIEIVDQPSPHLQFIHESVRSALLKMDLSCLCPSYTTSSNPFEYQLSQAEITKDCVNSMSARSFRLLYLLPSNQGEFVTYVRRYWLHHCYLSGSALDGKVLVRAMASLHPSTNHGVRSFPDECSYLWDAEACTKYGLATAIRLGNVEVVGRMLQVRSLYESGRPVNSIDFELLTLIHLAVHLNEPDIVQLLLAFGAQCHKQVATYGSAMWCAAAQGRTEIVRILVEAGASVHASFGGVLSSPLEAAGENGHLGTVQEILRGLEGPRQGREATVRELNAALIISKQKNEDTIVKRLERTLELVFKCE